MPINFSQISDTLNKIPQNFEQSATVDTKVNELSNSQMKKRAFFRVIGLLIVIGVIASLIYQKKQRHAL